MSRRRRITRYQETTIVIGDCRSLVPIDAGPIKRAEQKKCKDVIHHMDLARERLRRFNEESQPAFQQWMHSTFGNEITELRELAQKLHDLKRLISEIEDYRFSTGCSYHKAYQSMMDRKNRPVADAPDGERGEEPFDENRRDHDTDFEEALRADFESIVGPRHRWKGSKSEYDAMFEEFKESFSEEDFEHNDEGVRDGAERGKAEREFHQTFGDFDYRDRRSEQESAQLDSRLKVLYRTLARRLHPDVNLEIDQKHKDLWYQVQAAYEAKDIERLEALSAMSEIYDGNAQSVESVWSLMSLYEELRSGLRHLQRQINRCSQDLAWGFEKARTNPKKLGRFRDKMAAELKAERSELEDCIEYGERQVENWKNPPPPRKPRSKSKRKNTAAPEPTKEQKRRYWTKAEMDAFTGFGESGR